MQRYFATINNNQVFLSELDAHHLLHVMRSKVNDYIEVVDNKKVFLCEIKSLNPLIISVNKKINEAITGVVDGITLADMKEWQDETIGTYSI
mgnify:CR=1 FL=1